MGAGRIVSGPFVSGQFVSGRPFFTPAPFPPAPQGDGGHYDAPRHDFLRSHSKRRWRFASRALTFVHDPQPHIWTRRMACGLVPAAAACRVPRHHAGFCTAGADKRFRIQFFHAGRIGIARARSGNRAPHRRIDPGPARPVYAGGSAPPAAAHRGDRRAMPLCLRTDRSARLDNRAVAARRKGPACCLIVTIRAVARGCGFLRLRQTRMNYHEPEYAGCPLRHPALAPPGPPGQPVPPAKRSAAP